MFFVRTIVAACAFALFATLPGAAQAPAGYGTPMTLEQAKKAMAAAEVEAAKNNLTMAIAIVDSTGHLLMFHRMDNGQYGSIRVAIGKAETALDFRQSTKILDDRLASGGSALRLLTLGNATLIEGGLPIIAGGKIVGAIGVSGAAAAQDGQVAKAGADAIQ
jgi:glc operon protein GlcG